MHKNDLPVSVILTIIESIDEAMARAGAHSPFPNRNNCHERPRPFSDAEKAVVDSLDHTIHEMLGTRFEKSDFVHFAILFLMKSLLEHVKICSYASHREEIRIINAVIREMRAGSTRPQLALPVNARAATISPASASAGVRPPSFRSVDVKNTPVTNSLASNAAQPVVTNRPAPANLSNPAPPPALAQTTRLVAESLQKPSFRTHDTSLNPICDFLNRLLSNLTPDSQGRWSELLDEVAELLDSSDADDLEKLPFRLSYLFGEGFRLAETIDDAPGGTNTKDFTAAIEPIIAKAGARLIRDPFQQGDAANDSTLCETLANCEPRVYRPAIVYFEPSSGERKVLLKAKIGVR